VANLTPANTWNASAYALISMYAFYSDHFGMWDYGIMIAKNCYHEKGNELFNALFLSSLPHKEAQMFP
jgi:hypothetical protein